MWIDESFRIAQESVYVEPIGNGTGPFALTSDYRNTAKRIALARAALAAAREHAQQRTQVALAQPAWPARWSPG
jgi:hypothetical protein